MARYRGPILKRCRRLGIDPTELGIYKKSKRKIAGNTRKKLSDYGVQLKEKQKLKFIYGVLEKQFYITFEKAVKMAGKPGENLILLLERRLDNMVYRLRFAKTRPAARQLVSHGHVLVNGKRVTIASFRVKEGDVISIQEKSKKLEVIQEAVKEAAKNGISAWLELDAAELKGSLKYIPKRSEVTDLADVNEQLIVELYSK